MEEFYAHETKILKPVDYLYLMKTGFCTNSRYTQAKKQLHGRHYTTNFKFRMEIKLAYLLLNYTFLN
jgi:hypothetical protein